MKGKTFLSFVLLIILSISILYFHCTKNSVKYEYGKSNYLYASQYGGHIKRMIYVFSTKNDSLVDSIYLGANVYPNYIELSPDKRTLYVWVELNDTSTGNSIYQGWEIDTRSKAIKYKGPNSFPIISPDGRYLFGENAGKFAIFDSYSHQLFYRDSVLSRIFPICFDKRRPLAYGGTEKLGEIMSFNYSTKLWIRSFIIKLRNDTIPVIADCLLSNDGNTLYLLAYTFNYYFCVYDLTKDSLLVQLEVNSIGQLGIKPDDNTVYITDPGGGGMGCISMEPPPTGMLGVFDTRTNTPLPSIQLGTSIDSTGGPALAAYYIRITPDGMKAYLSTCGNRILVVDLIRTEALPDILLQRPDSYLQFIAL